MLGFLTQRFKRHIACFFYLLFYAQWVVAAELHHHDAASSRIRPGVERTDVRLPMISAPGDTHDWLMMQDTPDSSVVPGRSNGPIGDLSTSPAFRLPRAPLAGPAHSTTAIGSTAAIGGPNQPEMQSFTPVGANNMVDMFSGDFSYNIPLLDVGGYPVNIAYHSGRSMDEDASWVGLGWNINPGSITRDMRGVPDDFSGGSDTITKTQSMKPNVSWGMTVGADWELFGLPGLQKVLNTADAAAGAVGDSTTASDTAFASVNLGVSLGVFHTTYTGWGTELGLNPSLSAGGKSLGKFTGKLGISDNSQSGITLTPGLSFQSNYSFVGDHAGAGVGLSASAAYNSRTGLQDIQLSATPNIRSKAMKERNSSYDLPSAGISFAWPSYIPTMEAARTNYNVTFTMKPGIALWGTHPNVYFQGYYGREYIAAADTSRQLPVFGYLNTQNRGSGWSGLTDINREKELAYRENPPVPNIAIPSYTYDIFSINGEGIGGQFRAYRGDIGFMADPLISS